MKKLLNKHGGFTLIELLVVIGIIAILAAVVIIAINPARQFAQARDTQRWSNVNTLLNAIGQRMADNKGLWVVSGSCTVATLPTTPTDIGTSVENLEPCLVPTYVSTMVWDPTSGSDSDTHYRVWQDANGRITVDAPSTEIATPTISLTR